MLSYQNLLSANIGPVTYSGEYKCDVRIFDVCKTESYSFGRVNSSDGPAFWSLFLSDHAVFSSKPNRSGFVDLFGSLS